MTAKILDGRKLSQLIKQELTQKINQLDQAPGLDVILVGEDAASQIYVQAKHKACQEVGIRSTLHQLPADTSQQQLSELIHTLNHKDSVHGILLQLPLPSHLNSLQCLLEISPDKDVDGFHPFNLGCLMTRMPRLRPCTPYGIIKLLNHHHIPLSGKHAAIVGASNIVGRPLALEFLLTKTTVTITHRFTKNLADIIQSADIVVSATGRRGLIDSNWINPGAIVIDVGINRLPNGKISGDLEFESAKERASWITPVPGGVGPMTIATLLENTVLAATTLAPR